MKILSVVKYASRRMVGIEFENRLFFLYQSTGHNSKCPGTWYPFAGTWGGEEHPYTKIPVRSIWPDWKEWIPEGWIIKSAVMVERDGLTRLEYMYYNDRYDFPVLGNDYRFIAHCLNGDGFDMLMKMSNECRDFSRTQINEKGVNEWMREIIKIFSSKK